MESYRDENPTESKQDSGGTQINRWMVIAVVALLIVAGIAAGYGIHQQSLANQLGTQSQEMTATISQLRGQVESLTAKLNEMAAAQAAAAPANVPSGKGARSATPKGRVAQNSQLKKLQTQLAEQQKELKDTEDAVAKTRSDLEGSLSSTRTELTGSIARTHEELVALQKRGERNYFEFDLGKTKSFQREGPISLSLRNADPKHRHYSLALLVDDNLLMKKNVNLYEPIWIHREDDPQPVQIVVNKIDKNRVHGYVSAPKYRNSELGASLTEVSAKPAENNPSPPANPPANAPNPQQPPQ